MQTGTTFKFLLTRVGMSIIKDIKTSNAGTYVEKGEPIYTAYGSVNHATHLQIIEEVTQNTNTVFDI